MQVVSRMNVPNIQRRPRRTQEERSAETRAQLMKTAVECICELGFNGATTSVIAERANVSRGALNHHFKSRNEFMSATIRQLVEELQQNEPDQASRSMSMPEKIDQLVDYYWDVFSGSTFMAVLHVWLGAQNDPELSDSLKKDMGNVQATRLELWQDIFASFGIADDKIEVARNLCVATLRGLALQNVFSSTNRKFTKEIAELKRSIKYILSQ